MMYLLKRDVFSPVGLALMAVVWAASVAAASLGYAFAAAISAVNILSLLVFLLSIFVAVAGVVNDREGAVYFYLSKWGRRRYAAWRLYVNTLYGLAAGFASTAPYYVLRPELWHIAAAAVFATALLGSQLGTLAAFSARGRGYAYMSALAAWVFLALVYDLAVAFAGLFAPMGDAQLFALLVLNPFHCAVLPSLLMLDPHMLTLGAAGQFAVRQLGLGAAALLIIALYAIYTAIFAYAAYETGRGRDI